MAQETDIGKSWEEIVRAYAKAERELGVKVYCVLRICKKVNGEEIVLHRYDMPREILQRWRWVINWRMAKLTCENPRAHIYETLSFYDKTSGEAYRKNREEGNTTKFICTAMTPKEFYDKVVEMRKAQKEYFRFRAPSALSKSKQLEAEIDAEIKRVEQLLSEKEKARQTSLFGAFDEDLLNRSSND